MSSVCGVKEFQQPYVLLCVGTFALSTSSAYLPAGARLSKLVQVSSFGHGSRARFRCSAKKSSRRCQKSMTFSLVECTFIWTQSSFESSGSSHAILRWLIRFGIRGNISSRAARRRVSTRIGMSLYNSSLGRAVAPVICLGYIAIPREQKSYRAGQHKGW